MPNIDDLIRDKLSKDGQVLNLKAAFLREVGAKELAKREELKEVRALDPVSYTHLRAHET